MVKHDSILTSLGKNVRQAREKRALTQEKLAEIAEIDPTYVSGIERGLRNPGTVAGRCQILTRIWPSFNGLIAKFEWTNV
jgi:transcriptional regulator with XRE-family HTH domain